MKIRLDQLLVKKRLAPSRTKAQDMIRAGEVLLVRKTGANPQGERPENPALMVEEDSDVSLDTTGETLKYVSRAGLKLEGAIHKVNLQVQGRVCLDIGQSTGGFTDVLLKNGALAVWGIDVGHGQLHVSLREDKRVKYFENLNIREATQQKELRDQRFEIVVADLSFISLEKVLSEIYYFLMPKGEALLLVKPQFELERSALNKQGLVKDAQRIAEVEAKLRQSLTSMKFTVRDFFATELKGKDGNQEYFFYVTKS